MKQINYPNGVSLVKLKNRSVAVHRLADESIGITFKRLVDNEEDANTPCAIHEVEGGKVKVTSIRLSGESAYALYKALSSILKLSDISSDPLTKIINYVEDGANED
jgi:hypothetical protein